MKTILNKTRKPIKVPLSGGKILHLGPSKTGQISDQAVEGAGVRRLVEAGEIEIVGEGSPPGTAARDAGSGAEATQGHPPETMGHRRGNR